jgi:hypothetical protein
VSNTESAQTQWKQVAETLGFPDETQMWVQLYMSEKRTIGELSKTLGYGTATIARRINLCGVDKRKRGGATSPSRIAIAVGHLDQRYVRLSRPEDIAKIVGSSIHSIYRVMKEI